MTPSENEMPLGGDVDTYVAQVFESFQFVTVGTATPTSTYYTPIYYSTAGTATYVWAGTGYIKVKATG